MNECLIRASSLSKIMTEPRTKSEGALSQGAKTYLRELAKQSIYGVDFEFSSKEIEKGVLVEEEAIALVGKVYGLTLSKNSERRTKDGLTGEPDIVTPTHGRDVKSAWSLKTWRAFGEEVQDAAYEWQARAYMALWDLAEWHIDYCLLDTPEHLIGYEPIQLHMVGHIPARMRVTSWRITRDAEQEARIFQKIAAAQDYFGNLIAAFDAAHTPAPGRCQAPALLMP